MIFLYGFFNGEEMSVPLTPTTVEPITRIRIQNAYFDDLRVTKNTEEEMGEDIYDKWDYQTIMHAKFDGDTYAGNVKWDLDNLSYLLVKRKKTTDYKWTTIDCKDVQATEEIDAYNIYGIDFTCASGYEYQYAAVAIVDNVENEYSIDTVDVKSDGIIIADDTALWFTYLTDQFLDEISVTPNSIVETMYDRYPTIVRNTMANYEQITVNAEFVPMEDDDCTLLYDDDAARTAWNREAKLFLRNGRTKILRSSDGRRWLGYVTTPPSDTADTYYNIRNVTFTLTETGDPDSEKYLYKAGIIDVPENFWSYDN